MEIDASFRSHMCTIKDYKTTCGDRTWECMIKFAKSLKKRGTKVAFFSSTPQGGGVALMRHALVRFARVIGVNLTWYDINHTPPSFPTHRFKGTCPSRDQASFESPKISTISSKVLQSLMSGYLPIIKRP